MAHFAKINQENEVLNVIYIEDSHILLNGIENELTGQKYLEKHNNWPYYMWIKTSYNTFNNKHILGGTPYRGNYAGIGSTWDENNQIFWPKKLYASWVKHIPTASWKSPIGDAPTLTEEQTAQNEANTHGWHYNWNENNQSWVLLNNGPMPQIPIV